MDLVAHSSIRPLPRCASHKKKVSWFSCCVSPREQPDALPRNREIEAAPLAEARKRREEAKRSLPLEEVVSSVAAEKKQTTPRRRITSRSPSWVRRKTEENVESSEIEAHEDPLSPTSSYDGCKIFQETEENSGDGDSSTSSETSSSSSGTDSYEKKDSEVRITVHDYAKEPRSILKKRETSPTAAELNEFVFRVAEAKESSFFFSEKDAGFKKNRSSDSLCSSEETDFDEREVSSSCARVSFDLSKNETYAILAVGDMSWRTRRDCYWQPQEYAVMSQSRMWLERAVLRTGGRVRIEGESRRGLGLVCEPETRIARASKIQSTQRAILRMHAEGASPARLARFSSDTSSWATRNALICARKDLVAAGEPEDLAARRIERRLDNNNKTSATTREEKNLVAPRDAASTTQTTTTTTTTQAHPPTETSPPRPRPEEKTAEEEEALSAHSLPTPQQLERRLQQRLQVDVLSRSSELLVSGQLLLDGSIHRIDSNTSETDGLASLIRNDSLNNLSDASGSQETLAAYAAARARRRVLSQAYGGGLSSAVSA